MVVAGIDSKIIAQKGITLIEALVSTAIVGIGFIAVFQMVNYSIASIDVSGERTKTNYLVSMIAEDLIADRSSLKDNKAMYKYLADETKKNNHAWQNVPTLDNNNKCKKTISNPYKTSDIVIDNKRDKWNQRVEKRVKCRGTADTKKLKVFETCRKGVKENGKARTNCHYRNDDIWDKTYIGRMEIKLNNGTKNKFLYFQIQ